MGLVGLVSDKSGFLFQNIVLTPIVAVADCIDIYSVMQRSPGFNGLEPSPTAPCETTPTLTVSS